MSIILLETTQKLRFQQRNVITARAISCFFSTFIVHLGFQNKCWTLKKYYMKGHCFNSVKLRKRCESFVFIFRLMLVRRNRELHCYTLLYFWKLLRHRVVSRHFVLHQLVCTVTNNSWGRATEFLVGLYWMEMVIKEQPLAWKRWKKAWNRVRGVRLWEDWVELSSGWHGVWCFVSRIFG